MGQTALAYRFPPIALSAEARAQVRASLRRLDERHALFQGRPGLLDLCEAFLAHCSPQEPSRSALELVTSFLYLVMYFADRVSPATISAEAPKVLDALAGARVPPRGEPAVVSLAGEIGAHLERELEPLSGNAASFFTFFQVNLSAFVWSASTPSRPEDLAHHLRFRDESICAIAYLRLWGLLGGLSSSQETRGAFLFQGMERLSARVQALANDLRSVDRDRREGTPNAVLIWSETTGLDDATSKGALREMHDEALVQLENAMATARELVGRGFFGGEAASVSRYIDFIGVCTRGNDSAMEELRARYDR